jgi:hypothetical protein
VRALQAVHHVQPAARAQRFGREDGGGRRLGVHHAPVSRSRPFEVALAEGLARHLGDAAVVRHHVVAPLRRDRAAVGAGHHAAAVERDPQARHAARRIDQRRGGVAPAAQRVEDVVQRGALAFVRRCRSLRPFHFSLDDLGAQFERRGVFQLSGSASSLRR